jgi:hypothetical protein
MPTSRGDYFNDVDISDVVSGMNLLPLPVADMNYVDMHRRCQAGKSTKMSNARLDLLFSGTIKILKIYRKYNLKIHQGRTREVFKL